MEETTHEINISLANT